MEEGNEQTINEEIEKIIKVYAIRNSEKDQFINAFHILGVECEDDLTYLKDDDLIKLNIKTIPARKFIEKIKKKLRKKRAKATPNSLNDPKNKLFNSMTLISENSTKISPFIEDIKAREDAAREEALLLAEIERREDIKNITNKSTKKPEKNKEIEKRQQILSQFVTILRESLLIQQKKLKPEDYYEISDYKPNFVPDPSDILSLTNWKTSNVVVVNDIDENDNNNDNNNNNNDNNDKENNKSPRLKRLISQVIQYKNNNNNKDNNKEEKDDNKNENNNKNDKNINDNKENNNNKREPLKVYEEEIMINNCSLMEYETIITNKKSEYETLLYIQSLSDELFKKVGGAVCPSDLNIFEVNLPRKDELKGDFKLKVKWMLPMGSFASPDAPDPEDLAMWLVDSIPPADANSMGSKRGIFIDVDLNVFKNLMNQALYQWAPK